MAPKPIYKHFSKKVGHDAKVKQAIKEKSAKYSASKQSSKYALTDRGMDADFLVIVESPSKCAKIEAYLGPRYKCIASKGHIREIGGLKNIDLKNNFCPSFAIVPEKADHIKQMSAVISAFKNRQKTGTVDRPEPTIFLATDDDREGESIAWHLCEVFDLSIENTPRILFREITKQAILDAIQNPSRINMNMVYAQHARQVLDILVGFKISPILWRQIHSGKVNALSAGRCQTPALRLVYDRDVEGKQAVPEMRYKTVGRFFSQNIVFELNHEFEDAETMETFLERTREHAHRLTMDPAKKSVKSRPVPLNTSRLLQMASNVLRSSPKQTMQTCQTLYQNGFITYMRTENTKYSAPFLDTMRGYIYQQYGEDYIGDLDGLINKDDTNPHEAIRVTDLRLRQLPDTCSVFEVSMYKLIWRITVESCMPDAVYNVTGVHIDAPTLVKGVGGGGGSIVCKYTHILEIPVFLGWKRVTSSTGEVDQDGDSNDTKVSPEARLLFFQTLSDATKQNVPYTYIESTVVMRNKHSHYTEASLIQALEERGIGRPSTFAMLVDTIQDRGYVKCTDIVGKMQKCIDFKLRAGLSGELLSKLVQDRAFGNEKSKLVIQPVGILCIEFLIQHFDSLFSYSYTKTMEGDLDKIVNFEGNVKDNPWHKVCYTCNSEIDTLSKIALVRPKETYPLDDCHELVFQQFGISIRRTDTATGQVTYRAVKPGLEIDLDKVRAKQYSVGDLLAIDQDYLGEYEGGELRLKLGKFGAYVEWNGNRKSLRYLDVPLDQMDYSTVVNFLESLGQDVGPECINPDAVPDPNAPRAPPPPPSASKTALRQLTAELSIRKGKYGPYVYYKTATMAAPQFFPLKKCPHDYKTCDVQVLVQWIRVTYLGT